jgi:cobaltochelatase CobT
LDGEALLWAHTRFEKSGFKHWTCIVLSDGAPVDDSTLSENGKTYLADHLKWVISELDRKPNVQIVAVGIGRSVDADYPECKYVKDSTSLSKVLQVLLSEIVTGCQSISSTIPSDAPSEK